MWSRGAYYSRLLWWGLLKLNWPRKMRRVLSCWYWLWVKLTKRNLFSKVPRYMGKFIERRWSKKREQGNPFLEEWGLGGVRSCRYRLWVWLTKRNLFAAIKAGHSRQQPPPLYQTICLDLFRCTVLYSLYICNGEQCIHIMAQIWMQITVCLHCTDDSHTIHTQAVGTQHCPGKFIG